MHKFIEEQLRKGYIRSSKSPQIAPVFFVGKKDGKKYIVQNYWYLNDWTIKMIIISEIIESVGIKKVFTKLDVTNFIQLISPQPGDRFSQTKLRWKAPNEGYLHICGMYKSNNERLRYQAISSCKSFVC